MESRIQRPTEPPQVPHEDRPPQVTRLSTACANGYLNTLGRPTLCLWSGLLIGAAAAGLGGLIGLLPTGHQINDPILLALTLASLMRGFLYFNWFAFLVTVTIYAAIGALTWLILVWLGQRSGLGVMTAEVRRAVRAAVLISVIPVLIAEISGIQVIIWYALAVFLSMSVAGMTAAFLHRWLYEPKISHHPAP